MNPQLDYLLIGGPLGGLALRPRGGVPLTRGVINLSQDGGPLDPDYDYLLVNLPRARRSAQIPEWVLVHSTVPAGTIVWEAFMGLTRAFASQVLNDH